jgi:heme A synthase
MVIESGEGYDNVHDWSSPVFPSVASSVNTRLLENIFHENDGVFRNTAMFMAYLFLLTCCCITPCIYYLRITAWHRRHIHQLRELERAGMMAALAQSANGGYSSSAAATLAAAAASHHHHPPPESEAVREERRALILQLLAPVRLVRSYRTLYSALTVRGSSTDTFGEGHILFKLFESLHLCRLSEKSTFLKEFRHGAFP